MAKILINVELSSGKASEQIKALQAELQKVAETASQVGTSGSANATIKQVESLRKSASNLLTTIENIRKQFTIKKGDTSLDEYEAQLKKIRDTTKEYSKILNDANSKGLDDGQVANVKKLSDEMATLAANVAQYRTENDKVARANPFDRDFTSQIQTTIKGYQNLEAHIKSVEKYYAKGTFDSQLATIKQNETALYELQNTYGGAGKMTAEANAQLTAYTTTLGKVTNATKKAELENTNYHGTLLDLVSGFAKFQVSAMLVMKPLQTLQKAWASLNETLVETEDAVISIQRVISENLSNSEVANDLYKLAQQYGQTFENVSEIATNFARQGLSWTEAIDATKAALLALNVAELDATDASEGLVAIMTQFGYEASDLTYVIDVLNKTADNAAVTTEELLTALQKTGSYAKSANLSLEDTVAIITALSESTAASGQNIGNALKSLLSYTTQDSALSTFASLSDEMNTVVEQYKRGGATILDVWKQLSVEMQSLSSEQADLLESWSGDLDDELSGELSEVYDTMKGIYDTAGTYRKNYFIALMSNMDGVLEAQQTISDAAGYSQKENETYLESYTAKLNELQAKWEEIANDENGLLEIKKSLLGIASLFLDLIDATGGLRTTFIFLATIIGATFGNKILKSIKSFVAGLYSADAAAGTLQLTLNGVLGILGLIATAISVVAGLAEQAQEKAQEAQQAALEAAQSKIDEWNDKKAEIKELQELYDEYQKLTPATEDYYAKEEEIVQILKNQKIDVLDNLTKKTNDYSDAVANNTEKLIENAKTENEAALQAAKDVLANSDWSSLLNMQSSQDNPYWVWDTIANVNGDVEDIWSHLGRGWNAFWTFDESKLLEASDWEYIFGLADLDTSGTYQAALKNYELLTSYKDKISEILSTDTEMTQSMRESYLKVYNIIDAQLESVADAVTQYKKLLGEVSDQTDDTNKKTEEWSNSLAKVSAKVKTLLEYIQNMRDAEEASNKLAEKRQAILDAEIALEERKAGLIEAQNDLIKAQQDLENAKNERSVRVFNARTNQWEWQANTEDIEKAQSNVDKAEEAIVDAKQAITDAEQDIIDAIKDLEENGWDEIENLLESGNVTNAKMLEILDKYKDYLPEWVDEVKNLVKEQTGVDLDKPTTDNSTSNNGSGTSNGNGTSTTTTTTDPRENAVNQIRSAQQALGAYGKSQDVLARMDYYVTKGNGTLDDLKKFYAMLQEIGNARGIEIPDFADLKTSSGGGSAVGGGGGSTSFVKTFAAYDSGGILSGLGGIKATREDEIVLPPELTRKILTPTSNEQFRTFAQSLGLMFGAIKNTPVGDGGIVRTQNTTNNSDSRSYTINGVPIAKEQAERYTIAELCEAMDLVN